MILLSLASRQIWPHVLAVAHLKPERVFLLHSDDPAESRGPAQRLKRFFDDSGLVPKGATRLEAIPHDDFAAIERQIDTIVARLQVPVGDFRLNFTGGNKLMATAAFRWAARRSVPACYLERGNVLTFFEPGEGQPHTHSEPLDGGIANQLDPIALLRCQLDASEVQRRGQRLTLADAGRKFSDSEFFKRVASGHDMRSLLSAVGEADREAKDGDPLEFAAAATLLKLGVSCVQRGLRLKVKSSPNAGTRLPHAEIDLIFNWRGRLWLVDCKDRRPAENLADRFSHLLPPLSADAAALFERIRSELSISQTKAMKEDLVAMREAGGLLGQIVCVRKASPPDEVQQYAMHNQIAVVIKADLVDGLRRLLFPRRAADTTQLADLARRFAR